MQLYWLRPSIEDPQQLEIVQSQDTPQDNIKIQKDCRTSTKHPFYLSIEKVDQILIKMDTDLLDQNIVLTLIKQHQTLKDWYQSLEMLHTCPNYFNKNISVVFTQLEEEIFSKHNTSYIRTLILTMDFYMNLETFLFYIYWKLLQDQFQIDTLEEILQALISIKYICLNSDSQMEYLIYLLFDGKLSIPRLKRYEQAQLIIPEIVEEVNIFDISPHDLAESLTQINEEFYSHLKFVNVLTRLDNNEETEFMKEYFNRVNSFSLYIQLCILREKDRHSAIQYFYDVCLSLCENEDQEGVFLIYHLAIERIDLEFLQSIQYISNEQQAHIKEMIKRCSWDYRHIYTSNLTKKLYPIPSFHNFWIAFKRIESNLKNTKKLEALEPLRTILNDLMFIRQANYSRWKNQEKKIDPKLKYFLQKGHQQELSDWFKIEIGNWNEIQLALMKMAIKLTN